MAEAVVMARVVRERAFAPLEPTGGEEAAFSSGSTATEFIVRPLATRAADAPGGPPGVMFCATLAPQRACSLAAEQPPTMEQTLAIVDQTMSFRRVMLPPGCCCLGSR